MTQPQQQYDITPRNGLGIAALVLGVLAVVLGLIPILFLGTLVLALIAVAFGLIGRSRAKRGLATNKGMATAGAGLGIIGLIMSVSWFVLIGNLFDLL